MKIVYLPTKEGSKERNDAMVAAKRGTLWKIIQTRPTPKAKKKVCKAKVLTTIKTWDDPSSEGEVQHKRCSHKNSSLNSSQCA
jgi:hypothetical protein